MSAWRYVCTLAALGSAIALSVRMSSPYSNIISPHFDLAISSARPYVRWRQSPSYLVHSTLVLNNHWATRTAHTRTEIQRLRTSSASLRPAALGNQLSRTACAFATRAASARRPMLTHTPRAARRGVHGRYTGPGESHLQGFQTV